MSTPKPRILLVNCFPDEREMYAEYLQYAGFYSSHECAATDAFEAARVLKPDVVVTDIALTGAGSGFTLIQRLRADPDTARICIVVVSGFVAGNFRQQAHEEGADSFLMKPCLPEDLVRELRRILDARQQNACGT